MQIILLYYATDCVCSVYYLWMMLLQVHQIESTQRVSDLDCAFNRSILTAAYDDVILTYLLSIWDRICII